MNVHAVTRPNTAGLNGLMPTVSDPDTRNDKKKLGEGGGKKVYSVSYSENFLLIVCF